VTAAFADNDAAQAAVEAVAATASGHVGLLARHLGTGEELSWNPDAQFGTASTIKLAVYAEVMRQRKLGLVDPGAEIATSKADLTGGSGVLGVLRPGLRCTVADLCTLMIVVSDNTATNLLIDLLGGIAAVNEGVARLGYPGLVLDHKVRLPPPPLVACPDGAGSVPAAGPGSVPAAGPGSVPAAGPGSVPAAGLGRPLGTATPAEFCRLFGDLRAGRVVDPASSAEMLLTLRHQQSRSLIPRFYLDVAEPPYEPDEDGPGVASKTGWVGGCRVDTGLLYLPGNGGTVAYCAAADGLADRTMTTLAEGDELLGRLGAIMLVRWWPGPGPVPLRHGWLPGHIR
jgi:beta-lactamase class A